MNQVLREKVTHQLEMLPDDAIESVLQFITSLEHQKIQGIPGSKLMKFAGIINTEDAELMLQAVEQDCRRVDIDEW
jgi:hypothetical protein